MQARTYYPLGLRPAQLLRVKWPPPSGGEVLAHLWLHFTVSLGSLYTVVLYSPVPGGAVVYSPARNPRAAVRSAEAGAGRDQTLRLN
ncbi:hypothetical protein NDU88_001510 [Pleurodeles waltl]|uniref:Uncharacterized protein n=1 Tax=Pleurodeles waltl TaxID=8319 RepID=A0AAV7KYT3_PLEWA|nr:hypothetical protein NDU88_001510 [Pleurodeles waltl]